MPPSSYTFAHEQTAEAPGSMKALILEEYLKLALRDVPDPRPAHGALISAVAPLEEGPRWFERLYGREKGLMKVVLVP